MRKEYQKPSVYVYETWKECLMYSLSLDPQDDIIVGAKGTDYLDEIHQDAANPSQYLPWDE